MTTEKQALKFISTALENDIGIITMGGSKLNAFGTPLVGEMVEALDGFRQHSARVVIIRALPGSRVFSAGHDVSELAVGKDPLAPNDPLCRLVKKIHELPCPVIAMVEGAVWGGACEVVLSCDIVCMAETYFPGGDGEQKPVTFTITPAKIGAPYSVSGMKVLSSAIPLHVLKELLFTTDPLSARRAYELGIVNRVVPLADLENLTLNMAKKIASLAPLCHSVHKRTLNHFAYPDPLKTGTGSIELFREAIYRSKDYAEGLAAFREKRQPVFVGR